MTPFRIAVPDDDLHDLIARLRDARLPDQIPGTGWDYGTDMTYLRGLVDYWATRYDWRAQEARLNSFDQFTTTIDGQNVHFLHAAFARTQRAAARADPRLAGLDRRVP